MKMKKITAIFLTLAMAPALTLCAQTAQKKTSAAKKPAAAAKPAAKPVSKPAVAVSTSAAKPAAKPAVKPAPAAPEAAQPATPFDEAVQKLKSADPSVRRQGAAWLSQARDPKAAPYLVKALNDESSWVRQSAADGLGLLVWRDASPKLAAMLTGDKDAAVRQQAAISLSYLMDPAAGQALMKALNDEAPAVRYAALHTLGAMRYQPAEDTLAGLLKSDDPNMRRGAISALGQMKSTKATAALTAAIADGDVYARLEAIKAVGDIGEESAAPALKKLLDKSQEPMIRVEAALALAKIGRDDGLVTAFEYVKSPDIGLKNQALNVVGLVGDAHSLQYVEEMYAAEQDPTTKGMLDFTRQRLQARLKQQQKK